MTDSARFTAFAGHRRLASGDLHDVAVAVAGFDGLALIFDDATGRPVELDLREGPEHAVEEYHARTAAPPAATPAPRGRGRPRLGVVAREVTLLPRHWDWLATQPGGASAALRRLIDDARRAAAEPDRAREARDATYRVMSALAGDLPGFEDASRALFAGEMARLLAHFESWPADVGRYLEDLVRTEAASV